MCASFCVVHQAFTQESLDFQEKVLARSGLGEETYLPPCECTSPRVLLGAI